MRVKYVFQSFIHSFMIHSFSQSTGRLANNTQKWINKVKPIWETVFT